MVYHYDHLGSITAITDWGSTGGYSLASGSKTGRYSEDAWGQRRNPLMWSGIVPATTDDGSFDSLTPRGFTGHEMLDDLGLVHMNGRIYDPLLGRFLSADVLVQFPSSLQSYNRYSYVRNNPLTVVDPSGFQEGPLPEAEGEAEEDPEMALRLAEMPRMSSNGRTYTPPLGEPSIPEITAPGGRTGLDRQLAELQNFRQLLPFRPSQGAWEDFRGSVQRSGEAAETHVEAESSRVGGNVAEARLQQNVTPGRNGSRNEIKSDSSVSKEMLKSLNEAEQKAYSREMAASNTGGGNGNVKQGSFSITPNGWKGYPGNPNVPKPTGPFRLLQGGEKEAGRSAANNANRAAHRADQTLAGKQIHEIQPVKFDGSPTDPANKVPLTPEEHTPFTTWWRQLQRDLEK